MRGLTRRWMVREGLNGALSVPGELASLNLPPLVARVLAARGFADPDETVRFCEPKLTALHDPGLLPNIDRAVERMIEAVRRNELIVVYGDYDVDGITASAILYHVIKAVQPEARLRLYVPHRLDEGYGLNEDALSQLKSEGADLVITVDCGITAHQPVLAAKSLGLDVIITDHHLLPTDADLPYAFAIVHPHLPDGRYPFPDLCGAGVAYKLAWRFATAWCNSERVSENLQQTLIDMLPLVALGTIADVVPLIDENRVLCAYGLRLIKKTPLTGLRALIEAAGLMDESIDCEKVGFSLAPRLNACGRMGHAAEAVRMLTEASPGEAASIAERLTKLNQDRQRVERTIFDQAARMAEDKGMLKPENRAIILAHESWHQGVVGIVCSRLADRFGRPSILMQKHQDYCKGSARSIEGYSIYDGVSVGAQYLTTFGGHTAAAGLTLATEHLDAFSQMFLKHANEHITEDQLTPAILIDCDADLRELDNTTVQRLQSLSPFGRGNRRPTLRVQDVVVAEPPRQVGANGRHLVLRVRQETPRGAKELRTIWWRAGELAGDVAAGMRLDLAIEPKLNAWNGRVTVEAEVRDARIAEPV